MKVFNVSILKSDVVVHLIMSILLVEVDFTLY